MLPIGIVSIRRRIKPRLIQNSAIASTSWALTSGMTTILSLIGVKPEASAAARPAMTSSMVSRPVILVTHSRFKLSKLIFRRDTPAARKASAYLGNCVPLVESDKSRMPGRALMRAAKSGKLRRSKGSPPVKRTREVPRRAKAPTTRSISSKVSQFLGS